MEFLFIIAVLLFIAFLVVRARRADAGGANAGGTGGVRGPIDDGGKPREEP